jgi:hypothetical protein
LRFGVVLRVLIVMIVVVAVAFCVGRTRGVGERRCPADGGVETPVNFFNGASGGKRSEWVGELVDG